MILTIFLQPLSSVQIIKCHCFFTNCPNLSFCGFHTPVEWKIIYKVMNKRVIIQIIIVNTVVYIYGNIRLKEISTLNSFEQISILNSFEQIQENTLLGSAFSAWQLGCGFHTRPFCSQIFTQKFKL